MKTNAKKKSWIRVLVLLVCVPLFCVSAYMVFSQLYVDYMQNKRFSSLIEQVSLARANPELQEQMESGQAEGAPAEASADVSADALAADADMPDVPGSTPEPPMLFYYAPLYEQNPDFFGWVEIPGTVVDYPVMHTPEDPEFYLHRAFDGSEAYSGVPFLDGNCTLGCGNYIVYGHNMKNKTMFKTITYYADKDYWQEHPAIRFDTLYETGTYDVIAAFYSQAYSANATGVFRYYQYVDLRSEDLFNEYVEQVKAAALYDTGIEAEYGDQLLTLSTCEYHKTDGRFVVVARKR